MKMKTVVLVATALALSAASYVIRAATDGPTAAPGGALSGLSMAPRQGDPKELARVIRATELAVHAHPDALQLGLLSRLYLDRARLTSDLASYQQAEAAARESLRLGPGDAETRARLASIRFALHDFIGARTLARQMLAAIPGDPAATAVLGDTSLEIGDYATAFDAYGRLAAIAPGTAALDARLTRTEFLRGDIAGARVRSEDAMREAFAEGSFGASLAWYLTQRGQLELDTGHYDQAASFAEAAVADAPDYPVALALVARARADQGRITDAIAIWKRAIAIVPQPDYLSALGDLYALQGDSALAEQQYATVGVIAQLARASGLAYNRLVVLFEADHGRDVAEALRLAKGELGSRKDVYGWDAYGWALYANGRYGEARDALTRAMALGTFDARLFYHAGMIAAALGDRSDARTMLDRALTISSSFDPLQAPRARAALSALGPGEAGR